MGPIALAFLTSAASTAGSNIAQSVFGGGQQQQGGGLDLSAVFEQFFKKKPKRANTFGVDQAPTGPGSSTGVALADNPVLRAFLQLPTSPYG